MLISLLNFTLFSEPFLKKVPSCKVWNQEYNTGSAYMWTQGQAHPCCATVLCILSSAGYIDVPTTYDLATLRCRPRFAGESVTIDNEI